MTTTTTISRRESRRSAISSRPSLPLSLSLSLSCCSSHTAHTGSPHGAPRSDAATRDGIASRCPRTESSCLALARILRPVLLLGLSISGTHARRAARRPPRARPPMLQASASRSRTRVLLWDSLHFWSMGRREFVPFSRTASIHGRRSCVTNPCLIDDDYIIQIKIFSLVLWITRDITRRLWVTSKKIFLARITWNIRWINRYDFCEIFPLI